MKYVSNSFSLSMLEWPADIRVQRASLDEVREGLAEGFTSAVGHESTAALFSSLLRLEIPVNRVQIKLTNGDVLFVGQVLQRLPEGRVLSAEELAQLPIAWARVEAHKNWASRSRYADGTYRFAVWEYGLPPGLTQKGQDGLPRIVQEKLNRELGLPVETGWTYHPEHPWLGVLESERVPEDGEK